MADCVQVKYDLVCVGTALVDSIIRGFCPEPVSASGFVAESGSLNAGGEAVKAPLTGTVTTVNVKAGDAVKKGQVLMILEAMKMENEILSPCDGRITSVSVTPGTAVEAGTALCSIGR